MRDLGISWAPPRSGKDSESDRELDGIPGRCGRTIHVHPLFRLGPKDDAGRHVIPRAGIAILAADGQGFDGEFSREINHQKLWSLGVVAKADPGGNRSTESSPMPTRYLVPKGFKVASALSKDRTVIWRYGDSATGEECPIDGQLGI